MHKAGSAAVLASPLNMRPNVRMQRSGWDKVQIEAKAAGR